MGVTKRMAPNELFIFDSETGISKYIITIGDNEFIGIAQCAEKDKDMMIPKTGQVIAQNRAYIKLFKHRRDNVLKPQINILKQYYYSINQSKQYNENSYEVKMLKRQIQRLEDDLKETNCIIKDYKKQLNNYIAIKAKLFQRIRRVENKANIKKE